MTTFDQRVELRLSKAQLEAIDRDAEARGMKRSEWIRFVLTHHGRQLLHDPKRLEELARIQALGELRRRP